MIKIAPMLAVDYAATSNLLNLQDEPMAHGMSLTPTGLMVSSLAFWQHWLPCQFHVMPSIYVAKEEGVVLGFISLNYFGKSRGCWRIHNLIVHPEHRGRGIAQELLRYVFAQFGSQGVNHFIAEVSELSDAALSLFASCGFCRSAKLSYFMQNPPLKVRTNTSLHHFEVATPSLKQPLFQLHQDILPPDLRLVLSFSAEDFVTHEPLPYTSYEKKQQKIMTKRCWYWVVKEPERHVLVAAVKVIADPSLGFRLEFAVHPGWQHLSSSIVNSAVTCLSADLPCTPIWARVFDFQADIQESLIAEGFERTGNFFLMVREHWIRAKRPAKQKEQATVALPTINNPAINLPLATE